MISGLKTVFIPREKIFDVCFYKHEGGFPMKNLLLTLCIVLCIPFLSLADEVDKGFPANATIKIKESAKLVVQAGIESSQVIKMTQSMISDNFTEQQIIEGYDLLIKATKQEVPTDSIINKLYEGIAKNANSEKILQAMEDVRSRYEFSNTYTQNMKIDPVQSKTVAKEVADCLTAKMDKGGMNKIKVMLQNKTQNAPKSQAFDLIMKTLNTTRIMARSGVDSSDVVDVMNSAFKRNYSAGQMETLGNTFMTQAKGLTSAPDLARAYSSAIKSGATPDNFAAFNQSMPPQGGMAGGGPGGGMVGPGAPPPNNSMAATGSPASKSLAGSGQTGSGGPAPAGASSGGASAPPGAPPK
jgi:hypothetical protein